MTLNTKENKKKVEKDLKKKEGITYKILIYFKFN